MHRRILSYALVGIGVIALSGCPGTDKDTGDSGAGDSGDSGGGDSGDSGDTGADSGDSGDTGADSGDSGGDSGDSGDSGATDADGDGYIAVEAGGDDCDDGDDSIHPGATDIPDDGIDQDCDGSDAHTARPADDILPGEIIVTEIMNNPEAVGDSDGEWFEVYNAGSAKRDLDGLVVSDDGGSSFTIEGSLLIAPGEFRVIGASTDTALNGGAPVDYAWPSFALSNADDEIVLSNVSGEIDRVAYDDGATFPDPAGASMSLSPTAFAADSNDVGDNWCTAVSTFGSGDHGTPGAANDECIPPSDNDGDGYTSDVDCNDDDAAIHPGAVDKAGDGIDQDCDGVDGTSGGTGADDIVPGELVITEIMNNPAVVSDTYGEWFEVYNASSRDLDLDGLILSDNGTNYHVVSGSVPVPAGGYAVLGVDGDTAINGGVTLDYDYADYNLGNSGDAVVLSNSSGELDRVEYDGGTYWPSTAGRSMTLDPTRFDATENDDYAYWCTATSTFGSGDYGTPGADNDSCGVEDADGDGYSADVDCNDGDPTIYPGAPETPDDGIDQDCDGVDSTGTDADADGYTADVDCNDGDASIYPGAPEIPDDGIDQDCNGYDDSSSTVTLGELAEGDLVITEIMQNPNVVADADGEWFEVYNASGYDVDLDGLVVTGTGSESFTVSGRLFVAAGEHVVFGTNTDSATNGGVTVAYDFGSMTLSNSSDTLTLWNGTVTLDTVSWDNGATFPDPDGASMSLDPTAYDSTSNDTGANWCEGSSLYGAGDHGTPGAMNDSCTAAADGDGDGYAADVDCDDADPTVYLGAPEIPDDGIDQDCDGVDSTTSTTDADGDGYTSDVDCNDGDASVYPGAPEIPDDGIDQDCDGVDSVGAPDEDGDGYPSDTDCDDGDPSINPGAVDIPDDGIDQDCSGSDASSTSGTVADLHSGDLVISEIMQNPAVVTDELGEWFEVYNATSLELDLDGLVITGTGAESVTVTGSLVVPAGGYLLFATNGDSATNGGTTPDYVYAYASLSLSNSSDTLTLSGGFGTIDSVSWDNGATFPDPNGRSMSLDPSFLDAGSNDVGSNWCEAGTSYGSGDYGTPGSANGSCAVTDGDGDGYAVDVDCDDSDASVYPGAPEIPADGIDQDCDGVDAPATDGDGDGYGFDVDCDDTDATVYPGATEIPDDGIDQDCDGVDATSGFTVDDLVEGELVLTEITQNPAAVTDELGEWFEVYNASGVEVDLAGLVVTGTGAESITVSGSLVVAPGDYVVFATNADTATNGGLPVDYAYAYASLGLGNSSDTLTLSNAYGTLDTVSWDNGATFPDPNGASMSLDAGALDATSNDDGANWCEGVDSFGSGDLGTPGAANGYCDGGPPDADLDGYTSDVDCDDGDPTIFPGAPEIPDDGIDQDCDGVDATAGTPTVEELLAGDLVISEVLQNPYVVTDELGEWFEVYNASGMDVDLNGLVVSGVSSDAGFTVTSSYVLAAGDYAVFGANADSATNGTVTVDIAYAYSSMALSNSSDTLTLSNGAGTIDTISWDNGATFPDPNGYSMELMGAYLDATSNDTGANWCTASTQWAGGDYGTPGTGNDC